MKQDLLKSHSTNSSVMKEIKNLYHIHKNKYQRKIILSFIGNMNEEIIENILTDIENLSIDKNALKKIFYISVEVLQNIYHHNNHQNKIFYYFLIETSNSYKIIAANPVDIYTKNKIETHLNNLNSMEYPQIINLYQDILKNAKHSQKGTVGLGFISIKRKIKDKLNFIFKKIDFSNFIFIFELSINKSKK